MSRTDDQGFSLMEVLVTTAIMSVVMVVVLTATLQVYSGTKLIEQGAVAGDQVDISLGRLDRELRYATYVSPPGDGRTGDSFYVEFGIPAKDKDSPARCRQIQLDRKNKVLRLAAWNLPGAPTTRTTIATDVAVEDGVKPFTIYEPGTASTTGNPAVISQSNGKYSTVRLRFQVKVGNVVQKVDRSFTSQNITSDNIVSPETDRRCNQTPTGRP